MSLELEALRFWRETGSSGSRWRAMPTPHLLAPGELYKEVRVRWNALREATTKLKLHQKKQIHDPDRATAYQAYLKAMKDYEKALTAMM